jgi:hypothetical protein
VSSIVVPLRISAEEFQRLYQGSVKEVNALSIDAKRVRFPAHILRPFVTHHGIVGTFAIHFDEQKRFKSIEKID